MQTVIPSRFNGPDNSGNGEYSAGSLAAFLDGPTEVRLHAPPPLDRPLRVEETEVGLLAFDGDDRVMEAKPTGLDLVTPPPVSWSEAEDATAGFPGWELHGLRTDRSKVEHTTSKSRCPLTGLTSKTTVSPGYQIPSHPRAVRISPGDTASPTIF